MAVGGRGCASRLAALRRRAAAPANRGAAARGACGGRSHVFRRWSDRGPHHAARSGPGAGRPGPVGDARDARDQPRRSLEAAQRRSRPDGFRPARGGRAQGLPRAGRSGRRRRRLVPAVHEGDRQRVRRAGRHCRRRGASAAVDARRRPPPAYGRAPGQRARIRSVSSGPRCGRPARPRNSDRLVPTGAVAGRRACGSERRAGRGDLPSGVVRRPPVRSQICVGKSPTPPSARSPSIRTLRRRSWRPGWPSRGLPRACGT